MSPSGVRSPSSRPADLPFIEGPHPESADWHRGYEAGRAEAMGEHDHDPDKCEECQEMVMEALRD